MTGEPGWSAVRSLRPELRLEADAPMREVLQTLERALRRAGFRVGERQPAGFRARFVNWWALFLDDIERTTLIVSATEETGRTAALVSVTMGAEHPRAADRAARGVGEAIGRLRARHVTVSSTGWRAPGD